jgi:hypothetical protein
VSVVFFLVPYLNFCRSLETLLCLRKDVTEFISICLAVHDLETFIHTVLMAAVRNNRCYFTS